jgi:hypothetical protein
VAQLALIVVGELSWLWVWSRALGIATLRAPVSLVPVLVLAAFFGGGVIAPAAVRHWVRPGLARVIRVLVGALVYFATAELVWWGGSGGASPLQYGLVPLTDDALLLRGLAAGALVWGAWRRGGALPWPRPTLLRVEGAFRVWMQALGALFVLTAALRELYAPLAVPLLAAALVPLGAGLVGMPLARVLDIRRERDPDGRGPARAGGQWGWILGTSVTGLLLTAFLLSRALVEGLLTTLLRWLAGPAGLVTAAADWLLALLTAAWAWLMRSSGEEGIGVDGPGGVMARGVREAPPEVRGGTGDLDWLMSLASAFAAALLLALLWQLLTRARERSGLRVADDGVAEERDFVWPSLDGPLGLASLSSLLARLRRARHLRRRLRYASPRTPTERVRHLYRQLLRLGADSGRPREADETPREYETALAALPRFQPASADLSSVTALYSRVRYGETTPQSAELSDAEQALRRVRSTR